MAQNEAEEEAYQPKDAIAPAIRGAMICGGGGILAAAANIALSRQNLGPWAVITRTGGTIGSLTAMGGIYYFVENAAANLREKEDSVNHSIAGFCAGSVLGLQARSFPAMMGFGAGLAIVTGAYTASGGIFRHWGASPDGEEDYGSKEWMRRNRRRPLQETIDELGEGRGIYGPGYRERRADRIKATYGIDVPRE